MFHTIWRFHTIVPKICDKYVFLNSEMNNDAAFFSDKILHKLKVYWSPKFQKRNNKMFSADQETYHESLRGTIKV